MLIKLVRPECSEICCEGRGRRRGHKSKYVDFPVLRRILNPDEQSRTGTGEAGIEVKARKLREPSQSIRFSSGTPDQTVEQREVHRELVKQLKTEKQENSGVKLNEEKYIVVLEVLITLYNEVRYESDNMVVV